MKCKKCSKLIGDVIKYELCSLCADEISTELKRDKNVYIVKWLEKEIKYKLFNNIYDVYYFIVCSNFPTNYSKIKGECRKTVYGVWKELNYKCSKN